MTTFQVLGLTFVSLMFAVSGWNLVRLRVRLRASLFWLLLWGTAGVAIANPNATTVVAHALGIMRGADLVFYCSVLFGFVAFFAVYVRIRRLNREVTLLVRSVALRNPEFPDVRPESKAPPTVD
jgi:small membrane protein